MMHDSSRLQGVSWGLTALLRLRKNSYSLSCNLLQQSDTNQLLLFEGCFSPFISLW